MNLNLGCGEIGKSGSLWGRKAGSLYIFCVGVFLALGGKFCGRGGCMVRELPFGLSVSTVLSTLKVLHWFGLNYQMSYLESWVLMSSAHLGEIHASCTWQKHHFILILVFDVEA